jgi:hypothetical protein
MILSACAESIMLSAPPAESIILPARAESIILSAGGAKQQSTISCSKNVATMEAAEATVVAAMDLTSGRRRRLQ